MIENASTTKILNLLSELGITPPEAVANGIARRDRLHAALNAVRAQHDAANPYAEATRYAERVTSGDEVPEPPVEAIAAAFAKQQALSALVPSLQSAAESAGDAVPRALAGNVDDIYRELNRVLADVVEQVRGLAPRVVTWRPSTAWLCCATVRSRRSPTTAGSTRQPSAIGRSAIANGPSASCSAGTTRSATSTPSATSKRCGQTIGSRRFSRRGRPTRCSTSCGS